LIRNRLLFLLASGAAGAAGDSLPALHFSGSVAESASNGTVIGTVTISGAYTGTPTFSKSGTDAGKISIDAGTGVVTKNGTLDYETKTYLDVSFGVADIDPLPAVNPVAFTPAVTNVLEVTLSALTLNTDEIEEGSAEDTVVGALQSTSSGSTLSLTETAGSRFKLSGSNIVAGSVATDYGTATSHNITVRETHADASNSPRDSVIAITVTEVGAAVEPLPYFTVMFR
jgi:hypothetical protein